jgi:hypothetical protein
MTGAAPRALSGAEAARPEHAPIWRPAGKVAGRWLPQYLGDVPAPEEPEAGAVRVERRVADVRDVSPEWLYGRTTPLHPNAPELRRLGRRMHGDN